MIRALISFVVIALSGCAIPVKSTEAELRQNIIGRWFYSVNDPPLNFRQWWTFGADGTGVFGNGGGCLVDEGKGVWSITGNVVHITIDSPLANIDVRYEIQSVTPRYLKVKNLAEGNMYVFSREKS